MFKLRTYDLALELYKECEKLRHDNRYIKDQLKRASLSIVLNIAEGAGRLTPNDRKRFYTISLGSLRESQCLLEIMNEKRLSAKADKLGAHLYKLTLNPGGKQNRKQLTINRQL